MHIATESTASISSGPRLNLILHGLMAFRDAGPQHYDVLIPHPCGTKHEAMYGNPRKRRQDRDCLDGLYDFPNERSYYEIQGVRDGTATAARPSGSSSVILRNSLLIPQPGGIRTIVRVPK